jgi:hypothetical protein
MAFFNYDGGSELEGFAPITIRGCPKVINDGCNPEYFYLTLLSKEAVQVLF